MGSTVQKFPMGKGVSAARIDNQTVTQMPNAMGSLSVILILIFNMKIKEVDPVKI